MRQGTSSITYTTVSLRRHDAPPRSRSAPSMEATVVYELADGQERSTRTVDATN